MKLKTTKVGDQRRLEEDNVLFAGLDARRPWRSVVQFEQEEFIGMIVEDDDGAALCWNDFVVNRWVELYSSTALAMARLALLMHATEGPGDPSWFRTNESEFTQATVQHWDTQLVPGF